MHSRQPARISAARTRRLGKSEARQQFLPLVNSVAEDGAKFEITDHGVIVAVVLGYEEYQTLLAKSESLAKPKRKLAGSIELLGDIEEASKELSHTLSQELKKESKQAMTAKIFVTDTHPLVWYATEKYTKLSKKVKVAFDDAVTGQATIYVPAVVLWELSLLLTAGKIRLATSLDELVKEHFYAQAIYLLHLEEKDILIAHSLRFSKDMFDKLIVASALRLELPLITNDAQLHATKPCAIYW